ncbi:MAG: hypothetical protein QM632_00355 [Micrococcaceae bacterium]
MSRLYAVIIGFIAGGIATAAHQAAWFTYIPIGLLLGFIVVISTLVWWSDYVKEDSSFILMGFVMVITMLAMLFLTHDAYIFIDNWKSYTWIIGMPLVIVGTMIALVRFRQYHGEEVPATNPLVKVSNRILQ